MQRLKTLFVGAMAAMFLSVAASAEDIAPPSIIDQMREEAVMLRPLVKSDLANHVLAAAGDLPSIDGTRVVYWRGADRMALSEDEAMALDDAERETFRRMELDERYYYETSFGTPLAYIRALDLAAGAGFESADGAKVFDFGFGTIGHLRLLASLGADVHGAEVLGILEKFYQPSDVGWIPRAKAAGDGEQGSITLHFGLWPAEAKLVEAIGGDYDLIISKNVLKREYVHPVRPVDPRYLVHLGVSDEVFAQRVFESLKPGGLFVIYNLYPPRVPEDQPYQPWRSGECPFDRRLMESLGFEVIAFDVDDVAVAHELARALGWDKGESPMDLMTGLRGMYTILKKPAE